MNAAQRLIFWNYFLETCLSLLRVLSSQNQWMDFGWITFAGCLFELIQQMAGEKMASCTDGEGRGGLEA